MLLAKFTEPIQVEMTSHGGCPWLPVIGGLLGAALLAGVAFYAARKAAGVSVNNHAEQLRHERELHDERLKHDRELRERSSARDVLDDVAVDMTAIIKNLARFGSTVAMIVHEQSNLRTARSEDERQAFEESVEHEINEARESVQETAVSADTVALQSRVQLRFPLSHPIAETFAQWQGVAVELGDDLRHLAGQAERGEELDPGTLDSLSEQQFRAGQKFAGFLQACREWLDVSAAELGLPPDAPDNAD